jgi:hypothetical protein
MGSLLLFAYTAIIVRHHVTLKIVTVDDVISRSGGVYALPAPDHRYGVDGWGVLNAILNHIRHFIGHEGVAHIIALVRILIDTRIVI